jgi:hypothetical protein
VRLNDLHSNVQYAHYFRSLWIDKLLGENSSAPMLRTRVARAAEERAAAEELVCKRYAWRGYHIASDESRDHCVTLLAEGAGDLIGTLTVRRDSPQGLLAERSYEQEVHALRRDGCRLGEVTRLALEKGVDWEPALNALVHAAWVVTRVVHLLTDVVIEVNPRHATFYRRAFGFVQLASGRVCSRVGAPSVLLRLDLEAFGRRFGHGMAAA